MDGSASTSRRSERCPTCHRRFKRSHEQNARYWLLIHKIAAKLKPEDNVYGPETWHIWAKSKFLGCDEVKMPNKKTMLLPRSSADLAVDEFNEFMEKVEQWAAEQGVWLDE